MELVRRCFDYTGTNSRRASVVGTSEWRKIDSKAGKFGL